MNKFRLYGATIFAFIFVIAGVIIADIIPLPDPFTPLTTKATYAVIGILLSILFFSRFTSWLVSTTARLFSLAVKNVALEVSDQITRATSHGLPFRPDQNFEKLASDNSGIVILDTSSLIDGRILEIAKTGFLFGLILIPDFVLKELQFVADSKDNLKRRRGRRGFEIISSLRKIKGIKIQVWDKTINNNNGEKEVDDRLLTLAKTLEAKILTCDYNLNQVAKIRGIKALNINDLSNALRTMPIPGEILKVKLVHQGKEKDQMVGYLADGTMIVIKDAPDKPEKEVEVNVVKIIQGSAGRMVFGELNK